MTCNVYDVLNECKNSVSKYLSSSVFLNDNIEIDIDLKFSFEKAFLILHNMVERRETLELETLRKYTFSDELSCELKWTENNLCCIHRETILKNENIAIVKQSMLQFEDFEVRYRYKDISLLNVFNVFCKCENDIIPVKFIFVTHKKENILPIIRLSIPLQNFEESKTKLIKFLKQLPT